jgi:hypothetical protein
LSAWGGLDCVTHVREMGAKISAGPKAPGADTWICLRCAATLTSCSARHGQYNFISLVVVHRFCLFLSSSFLFVVSRPPSPSEIFSRISMAHLPHPYARISMELTGAHRLGHKMQERNSQPQQSLGNSVGTPRSPIRTLPIGRLCGPRALPLACLNDRASIAHSLFPPSPIRPPSFTNCPIPHTSRTAVSPALPPVRVLRNHSQGKLLSSFRPPISSFTLLERKCVQRAVVC